MWAHVNEVGPWTSAALHESSLVCHHGFDWRGDTVMLLWIWLLVCRRLCRVDSGVVRIDPVCFLAGYRKRQLDFAFIACVSFVRLRRVNFSEVWLNFYSSHKMERITLWCSLSIGPFYRLSSLVSFAPRVNKCRHVYCGLGVDHAWDCFSSQSLRV